MILRKGHKPQRSDASESPPPDRGDPSRCPTCGTERLGRSICHRCKSDLSFWVSLESSANRLYQRALGAYASGNFRTARGFSMASDRLVHDCRTLELLACSCLRSGDYAGAYEAARRHSRQHGGEND